MTGKWYALVLAIEELKCAIKFVSEIDKSKNTKTENELLDWVVSQTKASVNHLETLIKSTERKSK